MQIINFHGIGLPKRNLEAGEARFWIGESRFRAIIDRIAERADADAISITFDDGNISDLAIAVSELQSRQLNARFFVLAGRVGQAGSLGRTDIRDLVAAGMKIGSHGINHLDWTSLSPGELSEELRSSKAIIEDIAGVPVSEAAIPFGRYNAAVLGALRSAGYLTAFSSDGGSAQQGAFLMPRTSVASDMSDGAIDDILSGRMPMAKRLRRWAGIIAKSRL